MNLLCEKLADFFKAHFRQPQQYLTFLDTTRKALDAYRDSLPSWVYDALPPSVLTQSKVLDLRPSNFAFAQVVRQNLSELCVPDSESFYPPYYRDFDEPMPTFDESEPQFYEHEPIDSEDKVRWRNNRRDFERRELAWWKERKYNFEHYELPEWKERKRQYEKKQKEAARDWSADELAFIGTPFYDMWLMLKPELECRIPFVLEDKWRFGSQFVVGASRTGKTTFLTAQIMGDLEKASRGEASVIVMESQNEDLIPHLAQLKLFGKGGHLENKLIYLEPAKAPIAANIFDFGNVSGIRDDDKDELFRTAFDNIEFFLNSVFAADTTSHQITMLKYLAQAMPHIPGGNIFTLQQLLTEEGLAANLKHLDRLDPVVLKWLQTKLLSKDFSPTRTAVSNRLDFLVADPIFRKMFGASDNALDLYLELQKPKVILINTAGLGGTLEAFGRYFIAKLDEAMLKRKFTPKSAKLPVYFYVDEASEYFANEPRVGKVIDRLGKQMLASIFAVQGVDQFSPSVLAVLQRAAIQAWTLEPPIVNISVNRKEAQAVSVTRIELKKEPWVSVEDFEWMRQTMKVRYGRVSYREETDSHPNTESSPEPPQPRPSAKPQAPAPKSPPPDDDPTATHHWRK